MAWHDYRFVMPPHGVPEGITRDDVLTAIGAFEREEVVHDFADSTRYDLLFEGRRLPPKAILGIAARRMLGHILTPEDFSGGEGSKCFRVLRSLGFEVVEKPSASDPEHWTQEEINASVLAYLALLEQEARGEPTNKAETNRELREGALSSRSRGSVEFRMANISSVLAEDNKAYIQGYKPRGNVGADVAAMIRAALRDFSPSVADTKPESDAEAFEEKVTRLRRRGVRSIPQGQVQPERAPQTTLGFKRDPLVKAWVLQTARGVCELCDQPAPFLGKDGLPFLEVHHVKPLAELGSDTPTNAAALCPNCHRRCHEGIDRAEARAALYKRVARLILE